jgi:hypothetical protein
MFSSLGIHKFFCWFNLDCNCFEPYGGVLWDFEFQFVSILMILSWGGCMVSMQ